MQVSDASPKKYAPDLISRFSNEEIKLMYYWHALPDDWQNMDYHQFLITRRERMAKIIRDGYNKLSLTKQQTSIKEIPVEDIINNEESEAIEFKSTLRTNLHTNENDSRIELSVLKTIAAFMNSKGGSLIIGVQDDQEPVGIAVDKFESEDAFHQHLDNLIKDKIGAQAYIYLHTHFEDYRGERILVVECLPSRTPIYIKEGEIQKFYVRTGNSSNELTGSQEREYITFRFRT